MDTLINTGVFDAFYAISPIIRDGTSGGVTGINKRNPNPNCRLSQELPRDLFEQKIPWML